VGFVIGFASRVQPLGLAMGAFGASRSMYVYFIVRGRDVVFPKNTAMETGIASRSEWPTQAKPLDDAANHCYGHSASATAAKNLSSS
jgi:hypothetical protein